MLALLLYYFASLGADSLEPFTPDSEGVLDCTPDSRKGLAELSHSDFNTSPKVNVSTTFDFREDSGLMDHDFIDNTGIAD